MKGFTLVEVILVVAITTLLLAGSAVSLSGLRISTSLAAGADIIKLTLEKSRLSALVKENGEGYKLKFNEKNLVLFKGMSYDPADSGNKIINLPSGTEITSVSLSTGGNVVSFSHLNGTTTPGTIVLASESDPTRTRTIYIEGSGRVYHLASSGGGGGSGGGTGGSVGQGQAVDSGNQSFDLGWSIQSTSELKFKFLTEPSSTEIFIMQPHFNGNKSVFNFVGYFDAGVEQEITIYSNQLTPNNTVLSIKREPSGSGPKLEISIDDKLIATYFTDGTVSPGSDGGIMITQ